LKFVKYVCYKLEKEVTTLEVDSWELCFDTKFPEESNNYDCGVFACVFASLYSTNRSAVSLSPGLINELRGRLVLSVMKNEVWQKTLENTIFILKNRNTTKIISSINRHP